MLEENSFVERFQELNRFEVLISSVDICSPLTGLSVIVKVQHGSDRVNSQSVNVELVKPVVRA